MRAGISQGLDESQEKRPRWWRWLAGRELRREFWIFFGAAFFFDAGFAVYFFLFNLYLVDLGLTDRAIGMINAAFTLGSVVGTLPAGWMARRFGVWRLMIFCFVAAPLFGALRTLWVGEAAQVVFGFLAGFAMCTWGICFLPAVAGMTTKESRAWAFGLIFSVSVGTSALGGLLCGYLPQWLATAGVSMKEQDVKRCLLLAACALALVGLAFVLRLRRCANTILQGSEGQGWRVWKLSGFLRRFLPAMMVWSAVLAGFTPFANVYLSRNLHVPLAHVAVMFSIVQVLQLCAGMLTPILFRACGLLNGISLLQFAAALLLAGLAGARTEAMALALYVAFAAVQWMCSPGMYNLLMSETPEGERSTAAAMAMCLNAAGGAAATAVAGISFTGLGYPPVLFGIAGMACVGALLMRWSVPHHGGGALVLRAAAEKS